MSSSPKPEAAGHNGPPVWFPDTSALVTLAVHDALHAAVIATLSTHRRVLVKAVVDELGSLTNVAGPVAKWAATALEQLDWLGTPVRLDDPAGTTLALEIQEELARGRPVRHPAEHFGEAAILALACRARVHQAILLSDDYDARIAAHSRRVKSFSTHKLLSTMIRQSRLTSADAAVYAAALAEAGRAQDYTEAELTAGILGRVGRP